jgi:lysophospholipase L1-like esterase
MIRKLFTITLPAVVTAAILAGLIAELSIRAAWDPLKGQPGFIVSHPVRLEALASNYRGWFAGVPVRTNALGFRDDREYALQKGPATFRILVLGDSVTFGHGSIYEHTYPYLTEQRLKAWRSDVDWQVWNLGVPGYNTSQELAYLMEVGPRYRPDLVVVGFFGNDLVENRPVSQPTRQAVALSAAKTWLKRHLYSFDWYKREYLTLRYRLRASETERALLEGLAIQERLIAKPSEVEALREQRLTNPAPLADAELASARCEKPDTMAPLEKVMHTPGLETWKAAVRQLQRLHRDGTYRIAFFVNHAPATCFSDDVYDTRVTAPIDAFYLEILSNGTPATSTHDTFARYRPSQMPSAGGHSLGNSNALKADVLFAFLRDRLLPPPQSTHF